jgi:hypothetical protein
VFSKCRSEISVQINKTIIDDPKKGTYKAYRKDIIATMLKLRYDFGETAESINKLYIQTGLKEYSLSKLKKKNGI